MSLVIRFQNVDKILQAAKGEVEGVKGMRGFAESCLTEFECKGKSASKKFLNVLRTIIKLFQGDILHD